MTAKLKLDLDKNPVHISVQAHPATFKKAWKEICRNSLTCSAAKYLAVVRWGGEYVIHGLDSSCGDALLQVFRAFPNRSCY